MPKLTRAADTTRLVSSYDMAGWQMAQLASRPGTVDFFENLFSAPSGHSWSKR